MTRRAPAIAVCVALLCWHAFDTVAVGWLVTARSPHALDFASYHYAAAVAYDGGDPYDRQALEALARSEGTRDGVYPYFYPPAFLLGMAWTLPLELAQAYRWWFGVGETLLWLAVFALWRWWRPLGEEVGIVLLAAVAATAAFTSNLYMGQANLAALAFAALGLWRAERGHALAGGAWMGLACMTKMSPALLVAWWMLRGRWRAVLAACATAAALVLASASVFGFEMERRFWLDVLPRFASGDYNGLGADIIMLGNHSLASLWNLAAPATTGLSGPARLGSTATALVLVGVLAWLFRRPPPSDLALAAEVGTVGVAMLLVPVFTYDHHVVWALPALAATATATWRGALGPAWACAVGFAWIAVGYGFHDAHELWKLWQEERPWMAEVVRSSKVLGLLVLLAASARVATLEPRERRDAPSRSGDEARNGRSAPPALAATETALER